MKAFGAHGNGLTDDRALTALNRMASTVVEPLLGVVDLPEEAIITGGAASRGGPIGAGRSLAGLGSPENRVAGSIGDLDQRIDAVPGAALYVKGSRRRDHRMAGQVGRRALADQAEVHGVAQRGAQHQPADLDAATGEPPARREPAT